MAPAPAFENSNSEHVMANLTYGDGDTTSHMISDVDNDIVVIAIHEKGKLSVETSDHDNQSRNEMISISTCNTGEATSLVTSSFENQSFNRIIDVLACNKGKMRCRVTSHLENHNPNDMTPTPLYMKSRYEKGKSSNLAISDFEDQNPGKDVGISSCTENDHGHQSRHEMISISTGNIGETSSLVTSSFDNQKIIDDTTCKKGETRGRVASDLENHNPNDMTLELSYMKSKSSFPRASSLENQESYEMTIVSTNNESYETSSLKTTDFGNHNSYEMTNKSFYEKDEKRSNLDGLRNSDMSFLKDYSSRSMASSNVEETTLEEMRSQHKETYIPNHEDYQGISTTSSTQEGEEATLKGVQNHCNIDMTILKDNCSWMASDAGEYTLPEMDPKLIEELLAWVELENDLNSAL